MSPEPIKYEERLGSDLNWAFAEADAYFESKGAVQRALRKVTLRLEQLGIPYAVVGGMALFAHGFRRFTEDVDILIRKDDLKRVHENLDGLGYLAHFPGSKNLRDTDLGVKIEFLLSGEFPGDGKPKPVAFADPADVFESKDGIKYVNLPNLIEMKLASGISSPDRLKDLGDVMEMIKLLNLEAEFADKLDSWVREKYLELWKNSKLGPAE